MDAENETSFALIVDRVPTELLAVLRIRETFLVIAAALDPAAVRVTSTDRVRTADALDDAESALA